MRLAYIGWVVRLSLCLTIFTFFLFSYLERHNALTKLRLSIPKITKEIKEIKEENTRLNYEIEQFESPKHLLELARRSEFSHLKHPLNRDVQLCALGELIRVTTAEDPDIVPASLVSPRVTLATANP